MTITSQWVEPLNDEHHDKIIAAFNRLFIDGGGQMDGAGNGNVYGKGYGDGRGDGYGDGYGDAGCTYSGKCPEEWRVK